MTGRLEVVSNETKLKMYVCTLEEFILDDLHYLMYKMELRYCVEITLVFYTIATMDEKCENCS